MSIVQENKFMLIGVGVAALVVLYLVKKKGAAVAAGTAVGAAVVDAAAGVVVGIGSGLGIPATNMSECEKAKAEGRTWDASFACPASDFLSYLNPFSSSPVTPVANYAAAPDPVSNNDSGVNFNMF